MILYVDAVGGVAGDMFLAALIDAGAPLEAVNAGLATLGIPGLRAAATRTARHSIACCHVTITWDDLDAHIGEHADRDHDGALHGDHDHRGANRPEHQSYAHIRKMIEAASLKGAVKARAQDIFRRLAEAEAKLHGTSIDEVHFHEVGAQDTIGDIVGAAIALDLLGIDEVVCSPMPVGRGFVRAAHGRLPLPAPATIALLVGVPIVGVEIDRELVTPSGAAIVASIGSSFGAFPSMVASAVGYGAGTADFAERPNIVRAVVGTAIASGPTAAPGADVVVIETNLDDCLPEFVPDAAAAAMRAGALDVWTTPAQMKKGRPGFVLHAIARPADQDRVAQALLTETSALGVRISWHRRVELERSWVTVDVGGETVRVKLGSQGATVVNVAPEHDDCASVAAALSLRVKDVYAKALTGALAIIEDRR